MNRRKLMDTTKVYIACTDELNNDIVYGKLYSLVPKERQKKADRLVKREDKNLCVASFVLLSFNWLKWQAVFKGKRRRIFQYFALG